MLSHKKMGRPKSDNPLSEAVHIRIDPESREILMKYCEQEKVPKTEAIRRGIRKLKSDIKE